MLYVKYNTSSRCMPPLVATSMVSSWYPNIDGCGLQCRNPMLTDAEHNNAHTFVAIVGSTSLVCTLFAVVCFKFDEILLAVVMLGYFYKKAKYSFYSS